MNLNGSKKKKYLIFGTITSGVLAASITTPLVILNSKNNKAKEDEDINKIVEILKNKSSKEKIIELSSNASGKIIADNQEKIIEKIKTLIGKTNLKDIKIEVLMKDDTNISIALQKIIIKLSKNEISKEVKDFSVKKKNVIDEEIESIKNVLDAKTGEDLIITLPSDSTGNIIGEAANKNAIEKKLRILVDPSNANGEANHSSLKGTTIEISMNADAPISATFQDVIVSISKSGGTTLRTTKTFQVKRDFTADEDIAAIKAILDTKSNYHDGVLFITLPHNAEGSIIAKLENKNNVERKVRRWIDPLNTNGDTNHQSLRGTIITLVRIIDFSNDIERNKAKQIIIEISKTGGTTVEVRHFFVTHHPFLNS